MRDKECPWLKELTPFTLVSRFLAICVFTVCIVLTICNFGTGCESKVDSVFLMLVSAIYLYDSGLAFFYRKRIQINKFFVWLLIIGGVVLLAAVLSLIYTWFLVS